jgi:hypothetical protein
LTSSAWSPVIWTRKLTYTFLISLQLEACCSLWRLTRKLRTTIYPSDFCRCYSFNFLLYQGGLLSTSHINFSTSSTKDIAVWLKTQGLCTFLQLASNCLVASARGQTENVRPIVISNFSVAWRMGQTASRSNFSVVATEKLPVRALSYEVVFSIRATK